MLALMSKHAGHQAAVATSSRSLAYLGAVAATGVRPQTDALGVFATAEFCGHTSSVVRTWTINPAATKDHSQRERPT